MNDRARNLRHFGQAAKVSIRPPIRVVAAHIVARMAEVAVSDLLARYDLGCLAHHLRSDPQSSAALDELARMLDMHPSALRRYARVTERVRTDEFAQLLRLRNVYGRPLTWSHLEKLAEARAPKIRLLLAEEAVSGVLSVRALGRRIRELGRTRNGLSIDPVGTRHG